eukprot:TRINITY_DN28099_c0_g1_i1.p1 TRINITY_DN28099_c0_g1~~TRINITY_DN28099_c0_g1_i1.p1  ORF type:complete len:105 (+),score=20.61 TRINITY_DN28099_c0_g1_i1:40-354(+)
MPQPRWTAAGLKAKAAFARWSSALRAATSQLKQDVKQTPLKDIGREFSPARIWADFRRRDLMTQSLVAVTAYGVIATSMIYAYLQYSNAQRAKKWNLVVRSWNE